MFCSNKNVGIILIYYFEQDILNWGITGFSFLYIPPRDVMEWNGGWNVSNSAQGMLKKNPTRVRNWL